MTRTAPRIDDEHISVGPATSQRSIADFEPTKRLMVAVLNQAVNDFRTYAVVPTPRARRLFADLETWFDSPAAAPYDFETICHATGLDPDFIRRGLRSSVGRTAAPVAVAHEDRSPLRAHPVRPTLSSAPIGV